MAATGVPIGLIQLFRLNGSIRNAAMSALYGRSNEIRKLFLDRPELRKYFFDGADISEDDPAYGVVVTIAEMFLNLQEEKTVLRADIGGDWPTWRDGRDALVANSPIVRHVLKTRPERYHRELVALADQIAART